MKLAMARKSGTSVKREQKIYRPWFCNFLQGSKMRFRDCGSLGKRMHAFFNGHILQRPLVVPYSQQQTADPSLNSQMTCNFVLPKASRTEGLWMVAV
jgi:hypothetical protein